MDLNLIKVFLAVYRNRSITLASRELDLSQPAVSAALKRLKNYIQKDLFIRKGHGVEPTGTAIKLASQFEMALGVIDSATRDIGRLSVCCAEPLLYTLCDLDAKLIEAPPDDLKIIENLRSQRFDLVIDTLFIQDAAYVIEPLLEDEIVGMCRKDHPRLQGDVGNDIQLQERHVDWQLRRQNKPIW